MRLNLDDLEAAEIREEDLALLSGARRAQWTKEVVAANGAYIMGYGH
ncbi:hypothetical protein [Nonomuraea sp. NPDC050310]